MDMQVVGMFHSSRCETRHSACLISASKVSRFDQVAILEGRRVTYLLAYRHGNGVNVVTLQKNQSTSADELQTTTRRYFYEPDPIS
jgi:hypothetical protein